MKEKLGNFFGGLVVLISYVGSCFAISRFFDLKNEYLDVFLVIE